MISNGKLIARVTEIIIFQLESSLLNEIGKI